MFGIFGNSEAHRHPGRFPWILTAVWTVAILLITGCSFGSTHEVETAPLSTPTLLVSTATPSPSPTQAPVIPLDAVWEVADIEYAPPPTGPGGGFGGNVYPNPAANTIYISQFINPGTAIWRSTDWGKSWESLGPGNIFAEELTPTEVTIEVGSFKDTFPIHTWYSGGLSATSSAPRTGSAGEPGIRVYYAMVDTLREEFLTPPRNAFAGLVVAYDPLNPNLVLFGAGVGDTSVPRDQWEVAPALFFSNDGAETWRRVKAPSRTPWIPLAAPFSALGIAQDERGLIHLFVGAAQMWQGTLPAE